VGSVATVSAMLPPILLSACLLAWSLLANLGLGDRGYTVRNLALVVLLLALARALGLERGELGLARTDAVAGLRWGVGATAVVTVVVVGGVVFEDVIGPLGALLHDVRADLSTGQLAYAVLVRIPLGTALFEEVAFRGVLLAAFLRATTTSRAVVLSSVVFGLWHVAPTIVALRLNLVAPGSVEGLLAIVGGVLATTVGGALFTWLRLRSGSLLAPLLAHWAVNGVGLVAASMTIGG
jgi:uncharacterized protein